MRDDKKLLSMTVDSPRPFGWVRRDLSDAIGQANVRMELAESSLNDKREALENAALDIANEAMQSKKATMTECRDLLEKSQHRIFEILEKNLENLNSDQSSRISSRSLKTLNSIQEYLDRLSTHPAVATKSISIGKVDNRSVQVIDNEAAIERLKKFTTPKPVESEQS